MIDGDLRRCAGCGAWIVRSMRRCGWCRHRTGAGPVLGPEAVAERAHGAAQLVEAARERDSARRGPTPRRKFAGST